MLSDEELEIAKIQKINEIQKVSLQGIVDSIETGERKIQLFIEEREEEIGSHYDYFSDRKYVLKISGLALLFKNRIASIEFQEEEGENTQPFTQRLREFLVSFVDFSKNNDEIIEFAEQKKIVFSGIYSFPKNFEYENELVFFCSKIGEYGSKSLNIPSKIEKIVITSAVKYIEEVFYSDYGYYGSEKKIIFNSVTLENLHDINIRDKSISSHCIKIPFSKVSSSLISDRAFSGNENIKTLIIPESIKYIGEEAFANCPNLEKVVFPKYITICDKAFYNCSKLSSVSFEGTSDYESIWIGENAFKFCALKNLKINETEYIENGLFIKIYERDESYRDDEGNLIEKLSGAHLKYLVNAKQKNITIPKDIRQIEEEAFSESKIESVEFSGQISVIEKRTFYNCKKLSLVKNLYAETVKEDAFKNCSIENLENDENTNFDCVKNFTIKDGIAYELSYTNDYSRGFSFGKKILYSTNINKTVFDFSDFSNCSKSGYDEKSGVKINEYHPKFIWN